MVPVNCNVLQHRYLEEHLAAPFYSGPVTLSGDTVPPQVTPGGFTWPN
jgi:hypothetical protein